MMFWASIAGMPDDLTNRHIELLSSKVAPGHARGRHRGLTGGRRGPRGDRRPARDRGRPAAVLPRRRPARPADDRGLLPPRRPRRLLRLRLRRRPRRVPRLPGGAADPPGVRAHDALRGQRADRGRRRRRVVGDLLHRAPPRDARARVGHVVRAQLAALLRPLRAASTAAGRSPTASASSSGGRSWPSRSGWSSRPRRWAAATAPIRAITTKRRGPDVEHHRRQRRPRTGSPCTAC